MSGMVRGWRKAVIVSRDKHGVGKIRRAWDGDVRTASDLPTLGLPDNVEHKAFGAHHREFDRLGARYKLLAVACGSLRRSAGISVSRRLRSQSVDLLWGNDARSAVRVRRLSTRAA